MQIVRWDGQHTQTSEDELAEEEPLEIRVQGRPISVTMRTPGDDRDLAAGFLLTEGIIQRREDLIALKHCGQGDQANVIDVLLAAGVAVDFERLTRHVFASSSCGLCGKATIDAIHGQFPPVESDLTVFATLLVTLPDLMRQAQATFNRTGGLHAAALFDPTGRLLVVREDVGRHNAVDKLVGSCLLDGDFPLDEHVLVVSGRSSFEIMQKALAARVPIVAAVSAPSSLAVDFAQASGQTSIGFLRDGRMNVYTHPRRVAFDDTPGSRGTF